MTFAAQDDVNDTLFPREVRRCEQGRVTRGREGRRRWQRLKLGKTAQTVTLSKRDCSSESIVIIDSASEGSAA